MHPKEAGLHSQAGEIHKETGFLAEQRNQIAHGEWHLGPEATIVSETPTLPDRMGIKRQITKAGIRIAELPSASEFEALVARTRMLVQKIKAIHGELVTLQYSGC